MQYSSRPGAQGQLIVSAGSCTCCSLCQFICLTQRLCNLYHLLLGVIAPVQYYRRLQTVCWQLRPAVKQLNVMKTDFLQSELAAFLVITWLCTFYYVSATENLWSGGILFSGVSVREWVFASWKHCEHISKSQRRNFTQFWSQMYLGCKNHPRNDL